MIVDKKIFFRRSDRGGTLFFNDNNVKTPTFMPVGTRGAVKSLSPDQVRFTGANIILGNTYHLHLNPGEKTIFDSGGLAKFNNWHGPTLTDSGGFQVFSLGKINKINDDGVEFSNPKNGQKIWLTPEKSIQIQHKIGADIIMAFDDVVGLDKKARLRTSEAMDRTHSWLERCIKEHRKLEKEQLTINKEQGVRNKEQAGTKDGEQAIPVPGPRLFGIVQGGADKKLRQQSYEFIASTSVDGIAIGGLAVGEPRAEMFKILEFLEPMLDKSRPHYLIRVGHPIDMRFAIEHGMDMFDSVLPTRNARHGSFWHHKCCSAATCHRSKSDALEPLGAHSIVGDSGAFSKYSRYSSVRSSSPPRSVRPCSICDSQKADLQLNITNAKFAKDQGVLEEGCDCYTCVSGFKRAYLRHLIREGETLGGSLLSIHNLRYLQRICEEYQQ